MFRLAIVIVGFLLHPFTAFGGLAVDGDDPAAVGKRVALVIGNGAYRDKLARLPNPPNDARAIAAKLEALDFVVIKATDLDHDGMQTMLYRFKKMLSSDLEAALFFYAGHAMEYRGQNYIFPVDAEFRDGDDDNSDLNRIKGLVRISKILDIMETNDVPTQFVFLDACRDNPLADSMERLSRSIHSAKGGLASIDANPGKGLGTFIAYATSPGEVAEDGDGDHSPFTEALLEHLDTPGLNVPILMERVTKTILEVTNERQRPWIGSSLSGPFVFNQGSAAKVLSPVAALTEQSEEPIEPDPQEPLDAFEQTLSLSDKYSVQEALDSLGYAAAPHVSDFRAHTRNAIASWQTDNDFDRTGHLSESEFERLLENVGLPEVSEPPTPETIVEVPRTGPTPPPVLPPEEIEAALSLTRRHRVELQFSLARLGHYKDSGLDGKFGPLSRKAIVDWQREIGSDESGYLTEVQVANLYMAALPALEPFREQYRRDIARPSGSSFRDCTSCPDMLVIPADRFLMGSSSGGSPSERPVRWVGVGKFALGKFEITSEEWSACVGDGQCRPTSSSRDRRPVAGVTWHDAQAYVDWLRGKTGEAYYLPSEAEWEYAARAGAATVYTSGNRISIEDANFDGSQNSPELADRFRGSALVGGNFPANAFGLHDMHGNVREWVRDRWHDSYGGAPRDGRAWLGGDAVERVQRGGSWRDAPWMLRSAARVKAHPDTSNAYTGFRVARKIGN